MMMDLSDIITKEDSLAWATTLYICEAAAAATALHGWFFSGEPIVTGVGGGSSTQKGKIRRWSNFPSILVYNIVLQQRSSSSKFG